MTQPQPDTTAADNTAAEVTNLDQETTSTDKTREPESCPADNDAQEAPDEVDPRIRKANHEAASYRRQVRELEKKSAEAAARYDDLVKRLSGLAGGESEAESPEDKLTAAEERIAQLETERRDMLAETLVNRAAAGKTSDPDLLLAVLKSTGVLADLDISADDAPAQVGELIDATIAAHPALAAQEARRSSGNAATPPEAKQLLTDDDIEQMTPEEIYKAQREGKFNHLLRR